VLAVKPTDFSQFESLFSTLEGFERIALAVSGGSDSTAMLHLVRQWNARRNFKTALTVLSVDHGLRTEAAGECVQVATWCEALGLSHVTLKWTGEKPVTGLQAKARQARYDLMTEWCLANDVPVLLTGHTADDQAETVVMRKTRTSSLKSLAGIWPSRDWNGVRVMRPLLSVRRQDLREFLLAQDLTWIDDPSNLDQRYERVRVRAQLDGNASAASSAIDAQQQVATVRDSALHWIRAHVNISELGLVCLPRVVFTSIEADLADEVLVGLLQISGANHLPELKQRQSLLTWIQDERGVRRTLGGLVFAKRRDDILVAREPGRISTIPVTIPFSGEVIWDGRFLVKGPVGSEIKAAGEFEEIARRRDVPAFVGAGLPVVCHGKAVLAAPFHSVGSGVSAEFIALKHMLRTWNYKL
jgi:tRNA(Ile)-lysidine synthase